MAELPEDVLEKARQVHLAILGRGSSQSVEIIAAAIMAERQRCMKLAQGWEVNAAGNDYQTDGQMFWDAGNVYDQARLDASQAIKSVRNDALGPYHSLLIANGERWLDKNCIISISIGIPPEEEDND